MSAITRRKPVFFHEPRTIDKSFVGPCPCEKSSCSTVEALPEKSDTWQFKETYPCYDELSTLHFEDAAVKRKIIEMFVFLLFWLITTVILIYMASPSAFWFKSAVREFLSKNPVEAYNNSKFIQEPILHMSSDGATKKRGVNNTRRLRHLPGLYEFVSPEEKAFRMWHKEERREVEGFYWGSHFDNIKTLGQFWKYMITVFPQLLSNDLWISKSAVRHLENHTVLYNSELLGLIRFQQNRVKESSCNIHQDMRDMFTECYGYYSASAEENKDTITGWTFINGSTSKMSAVMGKMSTYGPGGYFADISGTTVNKMKEEIESLGRNQTRYIAIRAYIVHFNIYNPNINIFLICKMLIEIPPTGNVLPQLLLYPYRFLRYSSTIDYLICGGFEVAFCIFTLMNLIMFIQKCVKQKAQVFRNIWTIWDFFIVMLSLVCIGLGLYRYIAIEPLVSFLIHIPEQYLNFDHAAEVQHHFDCISAMLLFLVWIKLVKYLDFTNNLHILKRTIARSIRGVLGLTLVFLVVFLAFAQMGYRFFSSEVEDFSTFFHTCTTLLAVFLGEYNYEQTVNAHRIIAPIFISLYIIGMIFFILNLYLTVMAESYSFAKNENRPAYFTVHSYLARFFRGILKKETPDQVESVRRVRDALKRANFYDYEISNFFARYGISKVGQITYKDAKRIMDDLNAKRIDSFGTSYKPTSAKEIFEQIQMLDAKTIQLERRLAQMPPEQPPDNKKDKSL